MKISYKKLWILLIEKEISPAKLRKDLSIATGTMTKLRRNEEVAARIADVRSMSTQIFAQGAAYQQEKIILLTRMVFLREK